MRRASGSNLPGRRLPIPSLPSWRSLRPRFAHLNIRLLVQLDPSGVEIIFLNLTMSSGAPFVICANQGKRNIMIIFPRCFELQGFLGLIIRKMQNTQKAKRGILTSGKPPLIPLTLGRQGLILRKRQNTQNARMASEDLRQTDWCFIRDCGS